MSESHTESRVSIAIAVAVITGMFAAIPGALSFVNTPKQIEAELAKVREQNETQIQLQRDRTVAEFLARLDDPEAHVRSGAALSLSALGGDTIVPVLVGKLQEAVGDGLRKDNSGGLAPDYGGQRQFINALKQSLFAIGAPALKDLLDLNRDLTPSMKEAFRSRLAPGKAIRDMDVTHQKNAARNLLVVVETAREVKGVIRAILFKVANLSVAPPGQRSPLLEYGISLSHADLSGVSLIRLNLSGVNLSFADLRGASLEESYCVGAHFNGSLLKDALFLQGNFNDVDFRNALIRVPSPYFSHANFKGANFAGALLESKKFATYLRHSGALNVPRVIEKTSPR